MKIFVYNKSMKKYNAAIIGTGRIGFSLGFDKKREKPASHSFALYENSQINLVAACDTNLENLNRWQAKFSKASSFSSIDDFFAYGKTLPSGQFDIVVIAVNEESHLECALRAISEKPRLVILEKPVALNMDEAEKIRLASEKNGVPILVNHERRFAEDYKIARLWMDKIGDIQNVNARLYSGLRVYRKEDENTGYYSLIHDGTHLVDIVLYLLEKLSPDQRSILKNPKLINIYKDKDDAVRNLSVHFESESCSDVTVSISGRSRFFAFEIEVTGTEGRIIIGNGYARIYRRKESRLYSGFYSLARWRTVKFPKKTRYFSNMVQNAVDFLDGRCELRSTLQTGINALSTLEQMKDSILIK